MATRPIAMHCSRWGTGIGVPIPPGQYPQPFHVELSNACELIRPYEYTDYEDNPAATQKDLRTPSGLTGVLRFDEWSLMHIVHAYNTTWGHVATNGSPAVYSQIYDAPGKSLTYTEAAWRANRHGCYIVNDLPEITVDAGDVRVAGEPYPGRFDTYMAEVEAPVEDDGWNGVKIHVRGYHYVSPTHATYVWDGIWLPPTTFVQWDSAGDTYTFKVHVIYHPIYTYVWIQEGWEQHLYVDQHPIEFPPTAQVRIGGDVFDLPLANDTYPAMVANKRPSYIGTFTRTFAVGANPQIEVRAADYWGHKSRWERVLLPPRARVTVTYDDGSEIEDDILSGARPVAFGAKLRVDASQSYDPDGEIAYSFLPYEAFAPLDYDGYPSDWYYDRQPGAPAEYRKTYPPYPVTFFRLSTGDTPPRTSPETGLGFHPWSGSWRGSAPGQAWHLGLTPASQYGPVINPVMLDWSLAPDSPWDIGAGVVVVDNDGFIGVAALPPIAVNRRAIAHRHRSGETRIAYDSGGAHRSIRLKALGPGISHTLEIGTGYMGSGSVVSLHFLKALNVALTTGRPGWHRGGLSYRWGGSTSYNLMQEQDGDMMCASALTQDGSRAYYVFYRGGRFWCGTNKAITAWHGMYEQYFGPAEIWESDLPATLSPAMAMTIAGTRIFLLSSVGDDLVIYVSDDDMRTWEVAT